MMRDDRDGFGDIRPHLAVRGNAPYAPHPYPFPHVLAHPCLPEADYADLAASFPAVEKFEASAPDLDNRVLRIPSARVLGEPGFPDAWKRFVARHTSQAFWRSIVDVFGAQIVRAHPDIEHRCGKPLDAWRAVRRGSGQTGDVTLECQVVINTPVAAAPSAVKGPHVDHVRKLWTGLLYFRHEADDTAGGDLELFEAHERVRFDAHQAPRGSVSRAATVRYDANAFVGFANAPAAIHSVTARAPSPHVRRYVDFVAELDSAVFELPQMGRLRRAWFRLLHREVTR